MKITNLTSWLVSRARKRPITTIVVHATAGASAMSSVNWLRVVANSYHYLIDRDGSVIKAVPVSRVAFHAGRSVGPEGANVNEYSIGIAFANRDDGKEQITEAQMVALVGLCKEIEANVPTVKWLTTHKRISPGRKVDPRLFDAPSFVKRLGTKTRLKNW